MKVQVNSQEKVYLTSGSCTIHFPNNMESAIQGLTGYPNFGAAGRVTLAYDLKATE